MSSGRACVQSGPGVHDQKEAASAETRGREESEPCGALESGGDRERSTQREQEHG